ncbi:substrate-binding domain-containing protein [Mycobacteroides stephanolepidis]|uniref:substrate-binding domain-containing protein n=1 Tax=[Mycobacterium] stephanolepidis TaxID=1520670 RepID=UPI000BBA5A68|nr:substrate-binding domain-containing protein [[Mycobacterium] stephanolepidis]
MAAIAILLGGIGFFAYKKFSGRCTDIAAFAVAADPAIAPAVSKALDGASAKELGCTKLTVDAKPSAATAATLGKPGGAPALWLPDSSIWLARQMRATGSALDSASQSVARTPIVVAAKQGETPTFDSWLSVLKQPALRIGNPLDDAVVGALAEAEQGKSDPNAITAALVPIAQSQLTNTKQSSAEERLSEVAKTGGLAVSTEQQLIDFNAKHPDTKLTAVVPTTGAPALNYPIAVTEAANDRHAKAKQAGEALAERLTGGNGADALTSAGFRGPDFAPPGGKGLGRIETLTVNDLTALDTAMRRYAMLALPSRMLAVLDVSGSMKFSAGQTTRVGLLSQAIDNGLPLFPENAQIGLWAFSIDKGGPGQDWKDLLPIRTLDEKVGDRSQRQLLADEGHGLDALVGGGTGLYDTTLAAFRKVQSTYDPHYVNSVVIITDGANEDPNGISLDRLLATLKKEQDAARPVVLITLGITEDADAAVLKQISDATPGGGSRVARSADEIPNIVIDLIRARTAAR